MHARFQPFPLFVIIYTLASFLLSCAPESSGGAQGSNEEQGIDQDRDTISDADEGRDLARDTDNDGTPDYLDLDSDDDCIPDAVEAGDGDLTTPPIDSDGDTLADVVDTDSDNDGLPDRLEDRTCDGSQDPTETSSLNPDSDGDGASDLLEVAFATDPLDPSSEPPTSNAVVSIQPYNEPISTLSDVIAVSLPAVPIDIYVVIDITGSMSPSFAAIRSALVGTLNELSCDPGDDPITTGCIPNLETGVGQYGLATEPISHIKDVSADVTATIAALPTAVVSSALTDAPIQAMYAAVTGSCASDPGRIGTGCFRPNAMPVLILVTNEDFIEDRWYGTANAQNAYDTMAGLHTRVIGFMGNGVEATTLQQHLANMQSGGGSLVLPVPVLADTPACNRSGGGTTVNGLAILFGDELDSADRLACVVQSAGASIPVSVGPALRNDPANVDSSGAAVDAVASFVDYIETFGDGSAQCPTGLMATDRDADAHPETFEQILPNTGFCWRLVLKQNNTVTPAVDGPLTFHASLDVVAEGVRVLEERDIFFVVPPALVP